MMTDFGVGALGGVVLIDPETGLPYKADATVTAGSGITVTGGVVSAAYVSGSANNPHTSHTAARNSTLPKNFWQCATEPTNWLPGDEWIEV